ncbi:lipopolysaccharide biosynthesis protein [Vibrio agarivorans]|uniref:lipopolysaccharide biosynthesis protein n=1 Tax=Vibrio agarivorans TaxID=153622 RepID=UPI002232B7E7|nr:lipopolysaccharide biosynthesis protein [Vibrio agarivorans]
MSEEKFQQFRKTITPKQFHDIDFLTRKAQQLEPEDPILSKRILVRVRNLKAQEQSKPANEAIKPKEPKAPNKQTPEATKKAAHSDREIGKNNRLWSKLRKSPFLSLVILPTLLFAFYQVFWATERYESQAKVTVQQPDSAATMDASMAILSGLGVSNTSTSDTELIKTYIYSNDMLTYLEQHLDLRHHYSDSSIDVFSRLGEDDSKEELLEYFLKHVSVEVNDKSGVVAIYTQAFTPDFAQQLANKIVQRAEWYINSIGHQLAQAQLEFIRGEHQVVENKLQQAQSQLLSFQQRYHLLDPTAEGLAIQQITYQLEGQLSAKEAELKGLLAVMSANAPRVLSVKNEINALKRQLENERGRLAQAGDDARPVSEIMATFADLKIKVELALQAYTSSQVSLEKSRIEAYRQLKYLVVVEAATLPEDNKYPDVTYNVVLFAILAAMLFAIGRIIYSTIRELK